MSHASQDRKYIAAHIVARLQGKEGPDHHRQRAVAFLESQGFGEEVVGSFNWCYSTWGCISVRPGEDYSRLRAALRHAIPTFNNPRWEECFDAAFQYATQVEEGRRIAEQQRQLEHFRSRHHDDLLDAFTFGFFQPSPESRVANPYLPARHGR